MRIAFILKANINHRPPILSVVRQLIDLGHELILILTGIEEKTKQEFEAQNCSCHVLDISSHTIPIPPFEAFMKWTRFKNQVFSILEKEKADIVWVGSADATLALGKRLLQYPYILQIQELYDILPFYRKRLGEYMLHAKKVFVPEEVRAHIFRAWYHLKETPVVLPNKPYNHPRKRNLPITDPEAAKAFAKIPEGSKILFYQGLIYSERDLMPIVKAIHALDKPLVLAVQGKICDKEYFKKLIVDPVVYYIPFVPAPKHLEITSNVQFGIVTYSHLQMNNEFCAPNKIWEYSGFGLPMFGNDVYGLLNTVDKKCAGVFLNMDSLDPKGYALGLKKLLEHEEEYSRNSMLFFDSINCKDIIEKALKKFDDIHF